MSGELTGLRVKPLEWKETSWQNGIAIRWTGHGAITALIRRNLGEEHFSYDSRHFTTLERAQSAAQADYEARIRYAIEPALSAQEDQL